MAKSRLARVALIALTVLGFGACAGRAYVRSGLPSHDGEGKLAGASADVTVTRDEYGVPSIWAESEEDAYRALGYAHAQDRLWQMEFLRRVADGRLSEIFGEELVDTDRFMRTLGMGRAAIADEGLLEPGSRKIAEAYVAGVNAWLETRKGSLPIEFLLLRLTPEPWTIRNSLSIAKIIAADLASFSVELEHQRAIDKVGEKKAAELAPPYPAYGPLILGGLAGDADRRLGARPSLGSSPVGGVAPFEVSDTTRAVLDTVVASHASNAWVVGGARTASGKPIVANDTHLTLRAPSLFYLAALHGGPVQRAGVTIPGIPGVILGKAPGFAWGFTDAMVDDVDFYVEKVEGDSYLTPAGLRPFERRDEIIKVKGKPDLIHAVRATRHGPVLSDVDKRVKDRVLAMRWTAIEPARALNALLAMNRAPGWRELVEASRDFDTAKQNMIFASDDGTIGYVLIGKVPVRKSGDGILPVPGWDDEHEWTRFLGPEEKPRALNPPEGFIVTANNRQVGPDYPHLLTRIYASPFRAMRIRQLIESTPKMTPADVARHQLDVEDALAKRYLPRAVSAAEAAGIPAARAALAAWDGQAKPDSRAAALFYVWLETLRRKIAEDEWAGEKMYFPRFVLIETLDHDGGAWVDDVRTPAVETLDELAREAMKEAVATVGATKTWADFHATYIEHPLGRVKMLDRIFAFNMDVAPRGGSSHTVNVAIYPEATPPFKSKDGASHRAIVDLGDPDGASGFMVPTGQAGHPSSPNYRDLHALWLRGEVVPMPLDRARSDARAKHRMVLRSR